MRFGGVEEYETLVYEGATFECKPVTDRRHSDKERDDAETIAVSEAEALKRARVLAYEMKTLGKEDSNRDSSAPLWR